MQVPSDGVTPSPFPPTAWSPRHIWPLSLEVLATWIRQQQRLVITLQGVTLQQMKDFQSKRQGREIRDCNGMTFRVILFHSLCVGCLDLAESPVWVWQVKRSNDRLQSPRRLCPWLSIDRDSLAVAGPRCETWPIPLAEHFRHIWCPWTLNRSLVGDLPGR